MCSFSWREFDQGIFIAFNRDESIKRAKAKLPEVYIEQGKRFLMPVDPDAGGSWICVNQAGLVFALLNNYQGQVKAPSNSLISRGQIIKSLALTDDIAQAREYLTSLNLELFQPFSLMLISDKAKCMWQYDGKTPILNEYPLPAHFFSSAHPQAKQVLQERLDVANNWPIATEQDLVDLHRSHDANNRAVAEEDRTFSICMHHEKGHTQSLSLISVNETEAIFKYWNGQPCETDHFFESRLAFTT